MRIAKSLFAMLCILASGAGAARAELVDLFAPTPTLAGGATSFTMVFQGDVRSDLNLAETQNNASLNPFQYVNQNIVGSGTTSVTAALDGNGNTAVTFTGSNPILSSYTFSTPNGLPEVGVDDSVGAATPGGGPSLNTVAMSWSNASTSTSLPELSVSPASGGDPFAIMTIDITANGQTVGDWWEVPYVGTPSFTFTNYTGSSETLSNAGYFLSDTLIPLDQLNYQDYPPPGTSGSPFIPLPSLDGQTLQGGNGTGSPGGSLTEPLPEPSSMLLLASGIFATMLGRRRRFA